jgi:hypothetical protein
MKAMARPSSGALDSGAPVTRPRDGFSPTVPQKEDGVRIDPPPSAPCARGTMPAAIAAAEPPLDPATPPPGYHRFLVAP